MVELAEILLDYGRKLDDKIESLSRAVTKTVGWDYLPPEVKAKWQAIDENLTNFLKGIRDEVERLKAISPPSSKSLATFGQEVRGGDVGVLEYTITAENAAGLKHRIPAGTEVRVAEVRVAYISFYTTKEIGGQTYFTAPFLEFKTAFRKRGASPMSWGELVPPSHVCPVCGDPVAGGPDEYLGHVKTEHPEEWRRLETDPSYSLGRVVPVAVAGIMRCRWCGAPYIYKENLEIHERGCARRAGY